MYTKGISSRVGKLTQSKSIELADKIRKMKREGIDVIGLQTGEPDFDTPPHIIEAAYQAMKEGHTHYASSRGIPELRAAISEKLRKDNKINADAEHEIIVTVGTVNAISSAILATINPNDEIIIPDPCWIAYPACVKMAGGKAVRVPLGDNNSRLIESLEKAITPKTKMLILNYPCNPTGSTLTMEELKHIAGLAEKHDFLVLSDEIYEKIIYDKIEHHSIGCIEGMKERTITVNGFSKAYAMTGWRIGYACANSEIINQMLKVQQYSVTCVPPFVQKAAIAALEGPQEPLYRMISEYDQRRKLIVSMLNDIDGISCIVPRGTFYTFANISKFGMQSLDFASMLLDNAKVGVVPGSAYGPSGEGYVRLSFATSKESIEQAMKRIKDCLKSLNT